jgi:hypothetical protein
MGSRVEEISHESSHFLVSIPSGNADRYRLAQLDDYTNSNRRNFPLRYPFTLTLAARASSPSIPGTWGFGLWNNPFGLSLGFGGNPWRLPALPNAVWFFGASEHSHLSFHDGYQANGFLAQTFRSPAFHPLLIPAGLVLPFSRKIARRMLGNVIADDGVQLWSQAARRRVQELDPALQSVDVTQWHRYRLDWREDRVSFEVDEASGSIINLPRSHLRDGSASACWKIPNRRGWK